MTITMTITTTTDKPTRSPTTLEMIANGAASPAYLNVDRTLTRARYLLDIAPRATVAAFRALATRLGAHAEQLFRDHVREQPTTLPGGITTRLPAWDSDYNRLTYRLLLTYRQQAEQRITDLVRAASPGMR